MGDLGYARVPQEDARDTFLQLESEGLDYKESLDEGALLPQLSPRRVTESSAFSGVVACIILLNTAVIGLECQHLGNSDDRDPIFRTLEDFFGAVYIAELSLRVYEHGLARFLFESKEKGWNRFDFFVTALSLADLACDLTLDVNRQTNVLRVVRLLRIVRVLRIVRLARAVEYTLLSLLSSSLRVVTLVLMIDFLGGLIITNLLHGSDDEITQQLFGRLSNSMFFLFNVMVDGMGAQTTSPLSDAPGRIVLITSWITHEFWWMRLFWVGYTFVGTISLMALMPAITVELNLQEAASSREKSQKASWEQKVEKQRFFIERLFMLADVNNSNSVSREEIGDFLNGKGVLRELGLDRMDVDEEEERPLTLQQLKLEFTRIYDALEVEGRYEMSCDEFVQAFRQLRIKSVDHTVTTIQQEIFNLRTLMAAQQSTILDRLDDTAEEVRLIREQLRKKAQLRRMVIDNSGDPEAADSKAWNAALETCEQGREASQQASRRTLRSDSRTVPRTDSKNKSLMAATLGATRWSSEGSAGAR